MTSKSHTLPDDAQRIEHMHFIAAMALLAAHSALGKHAAAQLGVSELSPSPVAKRCHRYATQMARHTSVPAMTMRESRRFRVIAQ